MKPIILTLLCATALSTRAAIELNANVTEATTPMGFKAQHFTFRDKGRLITYEAPRGWTPSGGAAGIRLVPPGLTQAHAEIGQVPLPAPQNFDEETKKKLREATLASVPPDSQNVALVSETANPFQLNQNHTHEVVISYQAFGQEFTAGTIYMNLPDTQLRFRTVARKADFPNVYAAFRRSLVTWQWK